MKALAWVYPFNVFFGQRSRIQQLESEVERLRRENCEIQGELNAKAIGESITMTAMTSAMLSMCEQRVEEYKRQAENRSADQQMEDYKRMRRK